ncbi:MAG: formylglycine-generating enzyme family protein [Desulfobacteraceae bacterium]|nr:formylglycine-generating enzyme family protein [Desulfobacteraceae bacterium]
MDLLLKFRLKKPFQLRFVFFVLSCLFSTLFSNNVLALEDKITNRIGMEFILVQPGSFMMGSPVEEPFRETDEALHKVNITKAFYLQATEVTVKQWKTVMGKKIFSRKKGSDNSPVTQISFFDCQKYVKKLNKANIGNYRLPSEAEWEYACRAGTTTVYSWGNGIDCSKAMYSNNTKKSPDCISFYKSMNFKKDGPAPVKSFKPNPWGFYDMHGNVWEWCSDEYRWYKNTSSHTNIDTIKRETRIRRGGSWYKYSKHLRSANRTFAHPGAKFQTTGFRLVLEAD